MNQLFQLFFFQASYYISMILVVSMILCLGIIPFIQALFAYNKKQWLKKQFAKDDYPKDFQAQLLEASEPGQAYPIYKIFKFHFALIGIIMMISGFFIMVLPADMGRNAFDFLLFLPLFIGLGVYAVYAMFFKGQGLWREIAAVFLYIGITSTTFLAYGNFEMYEWLRADILCFIVLGLGLYLVYSLQSTFLAYIYLLAVTSAAFNLSSMYILQKNWLAFLPRLTWLFGIAILFIWIPKLRSAKDIGPKETIFGILFANMIMILCMTQTSANKGLLIPSLAIVLPGLYVFSKAYYHKAENILGRPIEIMVIILVIVTAAYLSTNIGMTFASGDIRLFRDWFFHKQVVYFILVVLMAGIFYIINHDFDHVEDDLNPMIASFPILAFIVAYVLGEYGGHYLMTIFLLALGFLYIQKGIEKKDSIKIALGAFVFVITLIVKITDILYKYLFDGKFMGGLTVFVYGAFFLAIVVYIRSRWTVTKASSTNNTSVDKGNDEEENLYHS